MKNRDIAFRALSPEMQILIKRGEYCPEEQKLIDSKDIRRLLRFLHRWPSRGRDLILKNIIFDGLVKGKLIRSEVGLQFVKCKFNTGIDFGCSALNHLVFRECDFECNILLNQVDLSNNFIFEGNTVWGSLQLDGTRVRGNLFIKGCLIAPKIPLEELQRYSFDEFKFRINKHIAISMNSVKIEGEASFEVREEAEYCQEKLSYVYGKLSCLASEIGSQMLFSGLQIYNPKGKTISCHGTKIQQDLMLDDKFTSHGFADFQGIKVQGQISLIRATLIGRENDFVVMKPNSRTECRKFTKAELNKDNPVKLSWLLLPTIVLFLRRMLAYIHNYFGEKPSIENRYLRQFKVASDRQKSPALSFRYGICKQDVLLRNLAIRPRGSIILSHAKIRRLCDDRSMLPFRRKIINPRTKQVSYEPYGFLYLNGLEYEAFSNRKMWKSDDAIYDRENITTKFADSQLLDYENRFPEEDVEHRHTAAFRYDWLMRQPPEYLSSAFLKQPWLHCAKVLNEAAQSKQAKHLAIMMEVSVTEAMKSTWIKPGWNRLRHDFRFLRRKFLRGKLMNYGYSPIKPILWALGIFIAFWSINFLIDYFMPHIIVPTDMKYVLSNEYIGSCSEKFHCSDSYDPNTKEVIPNYPTFSHFLYTLDQFIPIIDFGQTNSWGIRGPGMSKTEDILRYVILAFSVLVSSTGWFLTTLILIGLTQSTFKNFKPAF